MHLFLFDYSGTLTTLADPAKFIQALRQRFPDSKMVLHSGSPKSRIPAGVLAAVDDFWEKPYPITELKSLPFDKVTIVDDDELLRRTLERSLPLVPREQWWIWRVLDEKALPGLLLE